MIDSLSRQVAAPPWYRWGIVVSPDARKYPQFDSHMAAFGVWSARLTTTRDRPK